ncbi:hypothetical protein HU764_013695 [Pseudomonas sp. SWRI100]|uniref:hypothetical protein n=1 Tax=Pseudomonas TaxID=286 RepID=UPI001644464A|nr:MULTISPECIES: hypothetical protein [Pseudomonas]MBC3495395.1 hypothetical protein [Pseudomonas sp. SWRI67]MBV4527153.1 hypothetical protein [Pseudomonas kermanshahensis]
MSFRTVLALMSTVVYLYWFTVVVSFRVDELLSLPLNELGDFLAGAFGPLALAWLVFGYFQQGAELKQGTRALLLQADELRSSVEQQTEMVESQRLSLRNHERSLEPLLKLTHDGSREIEGDYYDSFTLQNLGHYCESVEVVITIADLTRKGFDLQPLFSGDSTGFYADLNECDAEMNIKYKRINGSIGAQAFKVEHYFDSADGPSVRVIKHPFVM